jgi:photosystem II stability/assembly factor-like uncharacterized protein
MNSFLTRSVRLTVAALLVQALFAQTGSNEDRAGKLLDSLRYRNIGPFRAGGWTTDIAVPENPLTAHLYTFYVGTRNGGVFKTTNGGDTFEPIFDQQDVFSIGALAVSPKDPNTLWVGTGDSFFARSPYFGNGVYKTTDGGKSWQHLGLEDTQHIAKIAIDPSDPNTVYVAAAGHAYTANAERGVFKTSDGGKTWTKSLFIDDRSAAIDLAIDPKNPKILYAAMWYRNLRRPGDPPPVPGAVPTPPPAEERGGIYRTVDAGKTWQKCTNGLPLVRVGRIGLALYLKDPNVVYAILDNQNPRPQPETSATTAPAAVAPGGRAGGGRGQSLGTEIYRTSDGGKSWHRTNTGDMAAVSKAPATFTLMRVDTENPDRIYALTDELYYSDDGGKTWPGFQGGRGAQGQGQDTGAGQRRNRPGVLLVRNFGDFRTLWIDPQNAKRFLIGSDGGAFASYDGGLTSEHFGNLPLGEISGMAVDNDNPYHIYVGEQDHEHWKGPVNGWSGGVGPEDWITVGNGDGENDQVDPTDSRWLYTTSENGQHWRVDQKTYTRKNIVPVREAGKTPGYRFNWIAPIRLSPHDPAVIYTGAQFLLRSMDRGDHWQEISPDLTVNANAPTTPAPAPPGGAAPPAGGGGRGGTITTICESPAKSGVLWVGSQNGRVNVSRNAGGEWADVTGKIAAAGGPEDAYVTRIFASHFEAGTAYVAKSRYGQDDPRPFLFKTTDFGETWENIASNLPQRSINAVAEDHVNSKLLFVGTDGGAYASLDGGKRWISIRGNMPQVAVMDLVVHPRESDLVLGSYGRGVWITDIGPLREVSDQTLAEDLHFFAVRPQGARLTRAMGNYRFYGDRSLVTPNEPSGLTATYYLRDEPKGQVTLTVTDASGKEIRRLTASAQQGFNHISWDMREPVAAGGRGGRGGGSAEGPRLFPPGEYLMTLQVGDKKVSQKARILEPVVVTP